jgi:hypothetical protein
MQWAIDGYTLMFAGASQRVVVLVLSRPARAGGHVGIPLNAVC